MLDRKPYGFPSNYKSNSQSASVAVQVDPSVYRSITGALQYLTLTRPDLSFAVNQACQHMHNPSSADFTALKRILSYIKGTLSFGLHINKGPLKLIAFSDADWAGDPSDRRSTTGYRVIFGLTPVSWCAKKQQTIAQSSTKAEYRSLAILLQRYLGYE